MRLVKFCNYCKETKNSSDFYYKKDRKDNLDTYCKICTLSKNKILYNKKESYKKTRKEYKIKNKEKIAQKEKEYRKVNKEKIKIRVEKYINDNREIIKNKVIFKKYGLTSQEYNNLLLECNNLCSICKNSETTKHRNGNIKSLSIDHCHKTGKVRSLLCTNCNIVLGKFNDSIKLFENTISYLKKYNI